MYALKKKTNTFVRKFSNTDIRKQIVTIMKNHIGRHNAITQQALFTEIYGSPSKYSDLELLGYWTNIRQSLHYLRKASYCFVISQHNGNQLEYFVVKDYQDADVYKVQIVNQVEKAMKMVRRAYEAADKKYYTKLTGNVTIEGKRKLLV